MKIQIRYAVLASAVLMVVGCSTEPATTKPAAAAAAAPEATAPEATVSPVASLDPETAALRKTAHGMGLTPRTLKGTEVYCRSVVEVGTRLPSTTCYTKAQLHELANRKQADQDGLNAIQTASQTEPNRG